MKLLVLLKPEKPIGATKKLLKLAKRQGTLSSDETRDSEHYLNSFHQGEHMTQAKTGDTVQVHYTGKLGDGTVFDTSRERHPLRFVLGRGQVIAGFEQAIVGMTTGESKTAVIPVDQAYGAHRADMVIKLDRSQMPQNVNPQVGQRLELTQADDQTFLVTVTEISETHLTVDANHPLAGKALTFDLELVNIL